MVRCVVRPEQLEGERVALDARQTKHVVTVLRLGAGDELVLVPGDRPPVIARLESVSGARAAVRVLGPAPRPPDESWTITLAAAVPRHPAAFDQMIDQATQLGASTIIPMVSARSVARPHEGTRHQRWVRLAEAAAQQSGRATIPRVAPVTPLADVLADAASYDRILLPTVGATSSAVAEWLRPPTPRRLLVLIGPEGDFAPDEIAAAERAGAMPISLGHHVLRCEAATVAILAVLVQALRHPARK